MSAAAPLDAVLLRTVLDTLQSALPQTLPALVSAFAQNGEATLLRTLLERRLIDPAPFAGDKTKAMAMAIVPLACSSVPCAQAMELIGTWFAAFGVGADVDLGEWLVHCTDGAIAAGLLAMGADALCSDSKEGNDIVLSTALHHALRGGRLDVVRLLLDDCLARDRLPLRYSNARANVFGWLVEVNHTNDDVYRNSLVEHIVAQPLTPNWRAAIGKAVLSLETHEYTTLDGDARKDLYVGRWLALLSVADLDATQWNQLFSRNHSIKLPEILAAQAHHAARAVPIIVRCVAGGTDPDGPEAFLPHPHYVHGTMLHAAVLAGNVPVVAALLEAGADPSRTMRAKNEGSAPMDCFALAHPGSETQSILLSWRAHQSIRRTIGDQHMHGTIDPAA